MFYKFLIFILPFIVFGQKNIRVTSDLNSFYESKDREFYFVYEIAPSIETKNHNGWSMTTDQGSSYALNELKSMEDHILILIKYDPIHQNVMMTSTISTNKIYVSESSDILFAGLQENALAYDFLLKLINQGHSEVASFLVYHDKDRAYSDYVMMYGQSVKLEEKKNVLYWISRIRSDQAFDFLDSKFNSESNDLKKRVIFCFRNFGKKGYQRLVDIAINENNHLAQEARFWIVNSAGKEIEKSFTNKVYDEAEIQLKESAIFSLYNQSDLTNLKRVAETSKDIRLRKKALFWLGQSHDVSIEYFAKLLDLN